MDHQSNGQSKVNEEINKALLNTTSARGVLTFCEWSAGEFDVTNAVTALHRMARAPDRRHYNKDPRWPSVIGKAHQMIVDMCAHEDSWPRLSKEYLVNAAWAFAALGHRDDHLMDCLCDEVLKKKKDLNPTDLASLSRSLANLKIQSEAVMDRILAEARSRIGQFRPQNLAGLSWSLATLSLKDEDIMDAIAKETISKVRLFHPRNLADLAWAFSNSPGNRRAALGGALTDATIGRIEEFEAKQLASIVHAFATMSAATEAVMEVIADRLSTRMQDLDSDSLERVAWAFGAAAYNDEAMMSSLTTEVLNRVEELEPRHLAGVAAAYLALGEREELLVDALRAAASARIHEFRGADLAKLLPALVRWGCKEEVECEVYMAVMERLPRFGPRELAAIATALEEHGDAELLGQFVDGAAYRFPMVSEYADGKQWVEFATIVAKHGDEGTRAQFEPTFTAALLRPFLQRLRALGSAPEGDAQKAALGSLKDFVQATQLDHLGPHYTRHALLAQYIPVLSADMIGCSDFKQVAEGSNLVAVAWEIRWRRNWWVEPCGRLFSKGELREGAPGTAHLLPTLGGTDAGAVPTLAPGRLALLRVVGAVARKCPEDKLREVIGCMRLVASGPMSVDDLVALCQFRRLFPGVRLEVDCV